MLVGGAQGDSQEFLIGPQLYLISYMSEHVTTSLLVSNQYYLIWCSYRGDSQEYTTLLWPDHEPSQPESLCRVRFKGAHNFFGCHWGRGGGSNLNWTFTTKLKGESERFSQMAVIHKFITASVNGRLYSLPNLCGTPPPKTLPPLCLFYMYMHPYAMATTAISIDFHHAPKGCCHCTVTSYVNTRSTLKNKYMNHIA